MKPHRHIAPILLSFAMLAGATAVPASAGPVDDLRAAHERNMQKLRAAHQRHVRAVQRVHNSHVKHAPAPVRKVDRFVQERHQAHRRFVMRTERSVERAQRAHVRGVENAIAGRPSAHRENVAQVRRSLDEPVEYVEVRNAEHASTLGSVGASVEKAHQRHVSALQRFADWLVGA